MNKTIFQLLFVVFFLLFLLAIIHVFDNKEGYNDPSSISPTSSPPPSVMPIMTPPPAAVPAPPGTPVPLTSYDPSNYNVQYHATAEDIQTQLGIDMSASLVNVQDGSGNIVQKPVSQTASDTTYYTSGTLKYNPANYVPNYEDTIYFSKLTGLGYQTPTINTNAQLSGFCKYDRYFPEKMEEKCGKLDSSTCAATTCCVLMGGKCFAGNYKGPYFKAHYGDLDLRNKDKYYYMGRCYGNCIDDQSNYYDYNVITRQSFPGFAEDNPAYLPNISDYLGVVAPNSFNTAIQNPNAKISDMQCRIDQLGNLVDSTDSVIAYNATLNANGNFVDSNGHILNCPGASTTGVSPAPAPASMISPVSAPVSIPVSAPVSTPVSTPVFAPVSAPVSTPVSTPVSAIVSPAPSTTTIMAVTSTPTTAIASSPIMSPTTITQTPVVSTPSM